MFRLIISLLVLIFPASVLAAPTRFTSPNYGVESIIFGGTGILRSTANSIPPVITVGPITSNITVSGATITWVTDKSSSSIVKIGTVPGQYVQEFGQSDVAIYTQHSVDLVSLSKGTTYYAVVHSADIAGNVTESAEFVIKTDPGDITPPIITLGPDIAINSATSLSVSWQTNKLTNTIVQFGIKDITENDLGQSSELTLFHQVQLNNLRASQTYMVRVLAKDASGNALIGDTKIVKMPSSPAITNVQISNITLNSALVQWTTTSTSTTDLKYGTISQQYSSNQSDLSQSEHHVVSIGSLISGTTYYLRLSGADSTGNVLTSDEYQFKTVILPQITNFSVSKITADTAILNWISSSDIDELVRYQITGSSDKTLIGKQGSAGNDKLVSSHTYTVENLESDSQYSVSVVGKDVFGNQALSKNLLFRTPVDQIAPDILNVKTDTAVDLGSHQSVQVLVSYGLSKKGTSIIEYGDGASGPYGQQVTTDTDITTNKFLVIPELQPGNSYHFHIVAKDKVGNIATSPDYLVLAPTQSVSLLDLIFGQIRTNFGWLGKIGS